MASNQNIANLNAYAADMTEIAEVLKSCKELGDNLKVIQKYLAKLAAAKAVEEPPAVPHPRYQHLPTPFGGVPLAALANTPVVPTNTPVQPLQTNTPVQPLQTNTPVQPLTTRNTEPMTCEDARKALKESNVCLRKYGYKIDNDYYSRYNAIQKAIKDYPICDVLQKLRALVIIYKGKNSRSATNLETDFAVLQTQSQTTPPPTPELQRTQKIRQEHPPRLKRTHLHTISLEFYGYNPQNTYEERMVALNKAVGDHGKANVEFSLMRKMNTTPAPLNWEQHMALRKVVDTIESDYYAISK